MSVNFRATRTQQCVDCKFADTLIPIGGAHGQHGGRRMDMTLLLGIVGGGITLLVTATGLAQNILEIRKLKTEIEGLKRQSREELIYKPTMAEVIKFQGSMLQYAKWLEEEKSKRELYTSGDVVFYLFSALLLFDFSSIVLLRLPANYRLSAQTLKCLKVRRAMLQIFGIVMSWGIGLVVVFVSLPIIAPLESSNTDPSLNLLLVYLKLLLFASGYFVTFFYVSVIAKHIGLELNQLASKKD